MLFYLGDTQNTHIYNLDCPKSSSKHEIENIASWFQSDSAHLSVFRWIVEGGVDVSAGSSAPEGDQVPLCVWREVDQQLWGTTAKCCSQQFAAAQRCLWTPFHSSGERRGTLSTKVQTQSMKPPQLRTQSRTWIASHLLPGSLMGIRGNTLHTREWHRRNRGRCRAASRLIERQCKAVDSWEAVLGTGGRCRGCWGGRESLRLRVAVNPSHGGLRCAQNSIE